MTITGQSLARQGRHRPDGQGRRGTRRGRPPAPEEAETRNNADSLVYQTEKLLKDQGDKFPGDEKDEGRGGAEGAEGGARGHRRRGDQEAHRDPAHRQPGLRPAPLRAGVAALEGAAAGRRRARTARPSDDEVVDAEIVDDKSEPLMAGGYDGYHRAHEDPNPGGFADRAGGGRARSAGGTHEWGVRVRGGNPRREPRAVGGRRSGRRGDRRRRDRDAARVDQSRGRRSVRCRRSVRPSRSTSVTSTSTRCAGCRPSSRTTGSGSSRSRPISRTGRGVARRASSCRSSTRSTWPPSTSVTPSPTDGKARWRLRASCTRAQQGGSGAHRPDRRDLRPERARGGRPPPRRGGHRAAPPVPARVWRRGRWWRR